MTGLKIHSNESNDTSQFCQLSVQISIQFELNRKHRGHRGGADGTGGTGRPGGSQNWAECQDDRRGACCSATGKCRAPRGSMVGLPSGGRAPGRETKHELKNQRAPRHQLHEPLAQIVRYDAIIIHSSFTDIHIYDIIVLAGAAGVGISCAVRD